MIDRTGQLLGNYRLIRRLGYGSFAEVYLGEHIYLNMLTAIKILRQPMTNSDSGDFLTEARTLAQLRHPHIVQILDFGIEDESPYLIMEYAPHGTLRQRYPKGTILPLPTVISYVKQIAAALQYAHDHEFIHRDVKPDNILLGANEQILLSDFGLALLAAHSLLYKNIEGIAGTFAYMAPEQLQGKVYRASDQYALGIVVYEWLCGERPFRGSHREVAAQQEFALPPPFYEKQEVERVVLKALAKVPHERFASIQAFAQALEEAGAEGQSLRTVPVDVRKPSAENEPLPNGKLPILFTSLIGREQEVIAVRTLLARPQIRLVTLLGPGGIGKTRLSLQVATEAEDHFADGVYFVPLAPIVDPTLVIPTLAQVLGIKENGIQTPLEQVKDVLQNKHLLLILDNIEQVVEAGAVVEDLLAACPKLKVVVTSRALLHLQAEHVFQVLPLALPDPKQMSDGIALSHYGAVALFVQRAQTILPTFEVTEANVHILVEICRRLDGLPLAIELAAARIRLLPPQALLARLSQRLHVLTGGSHTLPSRQQTLRNTIMWSYNLLNPVEQQLFRRLAVFVGGWTLEGAEAVLYTSHAVGETALGILDGIASLLDKSLLLLQIEQEGEEPHLIMLETIREYGLEVLVASGEMESVRQTHATYYLLIAEETEPKPEGSPQHIKWLRKLDREYDNIRAAMQWALEQKRAGHGGEMALRFGGALRRFWLARNYWSEGLQFLKSALSALSEDEKVAKSVRAKALIATAQLLLKHGDYEQGKVLAKESVELYRELQETAGLAVALSLLGSITLRGDNYGIARSLLEEALALFKKVGDQENAAWSLFDLGILSIEQGNYSEGRAFFEETLHIHREQKNKSGIAAALLRLGWLMYYSQGDPIQERSLLEESLALFRELVDKEHIADALYTLGLVVL